MSVHDSPPPFLASRILIGFDPGLAILCLMRTLSLLALGWLFTCDAAQLPAAGWAKVHPQEDYRPSNVIPIGVSLAIRPSVFVPHR